VPKLIPLRGAAKDPITGMKLGSPGVNRARDRIVRKFNRWLKTDKKLTEAPTGDKRIAGLFNEFIQVREEAEAGILQKAREEKSTAFKRRGK